MDEVLPSPRSFVRRTFLSFFLSRMENKKYVSVLLATALLASQTASAALDMSSYTQGVGTMSSDVDDDSVQTTSSNSASDSDDDSDSDEDASDNGDAVISGAEVKKGTYNVNGDLKVEGVLYVFGNLDVNGTLTVEKNAKVRVTGKLTVNGEIQNNGGSVYAAKRDVSGGNTGKGRNLESLLAELDPLLSVKLIGEEREGILQDIADSKGIVRLGRMEEFLDTLQDNIEETDVAAYEKIKKRLISALERKIKQQGGLKDKQLDVFQAKLETMPTEKLEVFIERVAKLQKATKKKRFAFQLSQLKELAEEVVEARSASLEEPSVGTPSTSTDSSTSTSTSTGTTSSTTSSGTTDSASGSTSTSSSGSTATGTTTQQ